MAEENQNSDDQKSPQPLDYLAPDQDEERKRSIRRARIFAGVMTAIAVVVGVPLFFISALVGSGSSSRPSWGPFIIPGIIAAFVISVTAYQHFVVRRAGFLQGVLIGLGVAALIEGTCFLAFLH